MGRDDIDRRFQAPAVPHLIDGASYERIREGCRLLAHGLNDTLPDGREKDESLAHLEVAMFWAHACLARAV